MATINPVSKAIHNNNNLCQRQTCRKMMELGETATETSVESSIAHSNHSNGCSKDIKPQETNISCPDSKEKALRHHPKTCHDRNLFENSNNVESNSYPADTNKKRDHDSFSESEIACLSQSCKEPSSSPSPNMTSSRLDKVTNDNINNNYSISRQNKKPRVNVPNEKHSEFGNGNAEEKKEEVLTVNEEEEQARNNVFDGPNTTTDTTSHTVPREEASTSENSAPLHKKSECTSAAGLDILSYAADFSKQAEPSPVDPHHQHNLPLLPAVPPAQQTHQQHPGLSNDNLVSITHSERGETHHNRAIPPNWPMAVRPPYSGTDAPYVLQNHHQQPVFVSPPLHRHPPNHLSPYYHPHPEMNYPHPHHHHHMYEYPPPPAFPPPPHHHHHQAGTPTKSSQSQSSNIHSPSPQLQQGPFATPAMKTSQNTAPPIVSSSKDHPMQPILSPGPIMGRVPPPTPYSIPPGTSASETLPAIGEKTSGHVQTQGEWQRVLSYNSGVHSVERCYPLKPPIPSKFWGDMEKTKDAYVPDFHRLVNYPDYLPKNRPYPGDGTRCCVMCGQRCVSPASASSSKGSSKSNKETNNANGSSTPPPAAAAATTPNNNFSSNHIIPRQNKGLCTACDVTVWVIQQSGLEIKWCKGCKNFRPWAAFGEKGLATKCVRCRDRQREKYASQKQEVLKQMKRLRNGTTAGGVKSSESNTKKKVSSSNGKAKKSISKESLAKHGDTKNEVSIKNIDISKPTTSVITPSTSSTDVVTEESNDASLSSLEETSCRNNGAQTPQQKNKDDKSESNLCGLSHLIAACEGTS